MEKRYGPMGPCEESAGILFDKPTSSVHGPVDCLLFPEGRSIGLQEEDGPPDHCENPSGHEWCRDFPKDALLHPVVEHIGK